MREVGWRTLIVSEMSELSCSDGALKIEKDDREEIFAFSQIKTLMINSQRSKMTTAAITELVQNEVRVIFCDDYYNPLCELAGYGNHLDAAGRIMEQSEWTTEKKALVWKEIVKQKIKNQRRVLEILKLDGSDKLSEYIVEVEPDDITNREAQAARLYFNTLFGVTFERHADDKINAALNYGYTILLSETNRLLTLHGYKTELGIKHCNRENRFNLSCDILEPFRPYIDFIVYQNRVEELDWEYKKKFIEAMYMPVIYDGKKTELRLALENYVINVCKSMTDSDWVEKDMDFIE